MFGFAGCVRTCANPSCKPACAKVAPPKDMPSTALLIRDVKDVVIGTSTVSTDEKLMSATLSMPSSK